MCNYLLYSQLTFKTSAYTCTHGGLLNELDSVKHLRHYDPTLISSLHCLQIPDSVTLS